MPNDTKKETTLFEDLERIQKQHEQEDEEVLEEEYHTITEDEAIARTQVDFIDDGKLDYDSKAPLKFKIGDTVASHVGLKPEELDRFSELYEKLYRTQLSLQVYHKSLSDQIIQKGNKVDLERGSRNNEMILDKLCDLKTLSFFCDLVELDENIKNHIITRESDKLFGSQVALNIPKKDTTQEAILGQLQKLTRILKRG